MVRREVSGAHYGLRDWLAQRVTAVVMVVYSVLFVVMLLKLPRFDFPSWKAMWSAPTMRYATLLFLLCLFVHAWIGMRNIVMDYVKPTWLRLTLYSLMILALFAYGAWAVQILWGR
ncbi:MAG: succinate dehydrogenase, hydrophobic membrane anchor protein [Betaproteobacteria bacterium]|nr:succinate dehydrogenase, hydrophobic membrane anchor protein [Betaproteobacteria bacterium]